MANITTSMRAYYVERLEAAQAALTLADAAHLAAMTEIESYTLDTGEARQTVKHRELEALEKQISSLEAKIAWYNAKINGGGLVNMNLRRRGGSLARGAY